MDQLYSGLALLLISVAAILRLDALILVRVRRDRIDVLTASLLALLSPVLCMLLVSYVAGKGQEERRGSQGAVLGTIEMSAAFLLSQLLTGFSFAALLFILGEAVPTGRAVGPWSSPEGFLPLYILSIVAWSSTTLVASLRLLRPTSSIHGPFKGRKLMSSSVMAIVSLPIMALLSFVAVLLAEEAGVPGGSTIFSDPKGPLEVGALVLGIAIIAPLAEELLFRGYLYDLLERRVGATPAVIVTAWLFALFHFSFVTFIPIFMMGLWMGHLRKRTGSILPSLVFHGSNNLLAIAWSMVNN